MSAAVLTVDISSHDLLSCFRVIGPGSECSRSDAIRSTDGPFTFPYCIDKTSTSWASPRPCHTTWLIWHNALSTLNSWAAKRRGNMQLRRMILRKPIKIHTSKAIMQSRISCKITEQHKITPLRKLFIVPVAKSVFSESTSCPLVTTRLPVDHNILEKLCYVDKRMLLLASVRQLTRPRDQIIIAKDKHDAKPHPWDGMHKHVISVSSFN